MLYYISVCVYVFSGDSTFLGRAMQVRGFSACERERERERERDRERDYAVFPIVVIVNISMDILYNYIGHYVPQLAATIVTNNNNNNNNNNKHSNLYINFAGFIVGNPSFDSLIEANAYVPFMASHALISGLCVCVYVCVYVCITGLMHIMYSMIIYINIIYYYYY